MKHIVFKIYPTEKAILYADFGIEKLDKLVLYDAANYIANSEAIQNYDEPIKYNPKTMLAFANYELEVYDASNRLTYDEPLPVPTSRTDEWEKHEAKRPAEEPATPQPTKYLKSGTDQ